MGGPFRRVLVGWDGSPDSAEALSVATQIAGRDGGHVVALAVLRQVAHPEASDDDEDDPPAIARLAEAQFEQLRRRAPASQVRLTAHVIVASRTSTGHAVCEYAAAHGFDLVVLGRRGEAGGRGARLGRVAGEAAHCSRVPLLLLSAP
jgi:nucleotide-binding universal stress UspA family protein